MNKHLRLQELICRILSPHQLHNPDITYERFKQQLKGHHLLNHEQCTLILGASEKHLLTYNHCQLSHRHQ